MGCLSVFKAWWRTFFDLLAILVLFLLFLGLFLAQQRGAIVQRGFYCDDVSIRFPAKPSTVPSEALVIVGILLVLIVLVVGNLWERFVSHKCKPGQSFHPCGAQSQFCLVPHWIVRICYEIRWFAVGFLVNLIITDAGKIVVGRLRPNFLDVCDPDFSLFNCTDQYGNPRYVEDFICRGDKHTADASSSEIVLLHAKSYRVSWPSGHSSISAYAFIFLALYISCVRTSYQRSAVRLMLMLFSFMLTMLTGLSRITDNKHHPTDVLSGWIIGGSVATIVVYYNLHYFGELKSIYDYKEIKENNLEVSSRGKTENT